jgi:hypothetical protein
MAEEPQAMTLDDACASARPNAAGETGLPVKTFPEAAPVT